MTEADAHKFVYRWSPRRYRCEVTRAKIYRIRNQFWATFGGGGGAFAVGWLNVVSSQYFRLCAEIVGAAVMLFGLVMVWRTAQAQHALHPNHSHNGRLHYFHRYLLHRRHRSHHRPTVTHKEMRETVDKTSVSV